MSRSRSGPRSRRFALGDRGRVPFALVGVVLLVTSAAFASTITPDRPTPDPAVDVVVERTTADARTAFRSAVAEASTAAAADPVVSRADTEWGRLLDSRAPFGDALRVRIYLAARDRFASVSRTNRGVHTNVSLPATPTPTALKEAIERIELSRTDGDGAGLHAAISNVTVTATDDGRVVGRENVTFAVDVPTPVLEAHERVATFERRLNAGATDPGLTQRLSGRLYALAWARGYAQYGGAPISNVIGTRHLELMANGALLEIQESAFGTSDPAGRNALTKATAAVGLHDVVASLGGLPPGPTGLLEEQLRLAARTGESEAIPRLAGSRPNGGSYPASRANETTEVSVGVSADRAFAATVLGHPRAPADRATPLNRSVAAVYSADVRALAAVRNVSGGRPPWPDPPTGTQIVGPNESTSKVVNVTATPTGPAVEPLSGYHRLRTYNRTVTMKHRRTITVREHASEAARNVTAVTPAVDNDTVERVATTAIERRRVRIVLVGSHAESEVAPAKPIAPVHERGGALDGPNLRNVSRNAESTLLSGRGGANGVAERVALAGENGTRLPVSVVASSVAADEPADLRAWLRADLAAFRDRIRNVSVSVRQGSLGTYEARPARQLLDHVRANRSRLLDVPDTYDGVAEKARVAVRARFLNAVVGLLEQRARNREETSEAIGDRLDTRKSPVSFETVQDSFDAAMDNESGTPLDDGVDFRVDGAPPYLTTTALDSSHLPSVPNGETVYPLVTENVNFATIPYSDVADALLQTILGGADEPETKLATAGQALRVANRTGGSGGPTVSTGNRTALTAEIKAELYGGRVIDEPLGLVGRLGALLEQYGVENGSPLVGRVLDERGPVHARALAVANGSVVDPLVDAAAGEANGTLDSPGAREELRSALRGHLHAILDSESVSVSGTVTTAVAKELKSEVSERITGSINRTVARRTGGAVSRLPAGIPITPIPAAWYATAGIWSVKVRGEYQRFAVETRRRTPDATDPAVRYVRDGGNVTLDVDGDGERELFGYADRVSFAVATGVVVVVPSGPPGVGDVDGKLDEESSGWPFPGPVSERPERCTVSLPPTMAGDRIRLSARDCRRLRRAANASEGRFSVAAWLEHNDGNLSSPDALPDRDRPRDGAAARLSMLSTEASTPSVRAPAAVRQRPVSRRE